MQTRKDVDEILTEGFNMAHNNASHQVNDALREATFHVPHELARLNKDATDFRLVDLGPIVDSNKIMDKFCQKYPSLALVDCEEETRVFLYFPNGATKATAIFVAVNADLKHPLKLRWAAESFKRAIRANVEVNLLVTVWRLQHRLWTRSHPAVVGSIEEMERLPIIFNFREKAFGAMYYKRLGTVLDPSMCVIPLITARLDRGILSQST